MRHDAHFVDEITSERPEAVGRMIDTERVRPNPYQPRKEFGDLSEMIASVKEKGILEPILVRTADADGRYEIIAGERRYQAAKRAGLSRIPCIEVDVDSRGMLEISLIENLQRRDLTAFEEAAAIQSLSDQFRYTHEEISRKLGKSRTVITEILSLNRMPEEIQERCRQADILSKSMLLQIVRQQDLEHMHRLIDKITGEGYTRDQARDFNREERSARRRRQYTYRFRPEDGDFQITMTFGRPEVERADMISALRGMLDRLLAEEESGGDAAAAPEAHAERPVRRTLGSILRPGRPNSSTRSAD